MWQWRNSKGKERLKKKCKANEDTGSSLLELKLRH